MTITIDTIELTNPVNGRAVNLKMTPENFEVTEIDVEWERAIDGTRWEWVRDVPGWQADLTGTDNTGIIEKSILNSLQVLANVKNAVYEMDYHGTSYNVQFRIDDPPVISATPIVYRMPEASTDYYNNVIIKLWIVEAI